MIDLIQDLIFCMRIRLKMNVHRGVIGVLWDAVDQPPSMVIIAGAKYF
jgi:hypothetical protein